jgi:3-methyladenine DNA glycosylase Tag
LDKETPDGFPGFVWKLAPLDPRERLIREFPDSHMRTEFTSGVDRVDADGVHPTTSIAAACKALKKAGFSFMGETTTLSWFQAAGLVNHHKADCFRHAPSNAEFDAVCKSLEIALPPNIHVLPDADNAATKAPKRK